MTFVFDMLIVLGLLFAVEPTVYLAGKKSEENTDSAHYSLLELIYSKNNAVKISYAVSAVLLIAAAAVSVCFNAEML